MYCNGGQIFSQYIPCYFAHLTDVDVHSLQIQIYCCKANHTTDITLHRVKDYFPLYFVKHSQYQVTLQIKIMDLYDNKILCPVPIF